MNADLSRPEPLLVRDTTGRPGPCCRRVVAAAVEIRRNQQPGGGESRIPFGEVEIAGHDGGGLRVALGDEVVQVFVSGRTKRLRPKSSITRSAIRSSVFKRPSQCWWPGRRSASG